MMRIVWFVAILGFAAPFADAADRGAAERPRRPGGVLYKPKANAGPQQIAVRDWILQLHGAQSHRGNGKSGLRIDTVDVTGTSEEEVAKLLIATGAVEFAEPDWLCSPVAAPNDTNFSSQYFHTKMQSVAGWDALPSSVVNSATQIIVAVCDTGVDGNHPDLAAKMVPGINIVTGSTTLTGPNIGTVGWHGTAVAGCVAAIGNNNRGGAGVAWPVNVRIMPIRITNDPSNSAYISHMAEAIEWAADHGAKVVNLSYGGAYSNTINLAAQYLRTKGGLLVMAAGNENNNGDEQTLYSDFTSFIQVGATDEDDEKAGFSNFGNYIDVVAPGVDIYTTRPNNSYGEVSGTSFSSPITAGLAALLYAIRPTFTPAQVEGFIFSNCDDLGTPATFGNGRINVNKAVAAALLAAGPNANPTADFTADPTTLIVGESVSFDASASDDSDGTIVSYLWDFGDGSTATGATASHTYTTVANRTASLTVIDNNGGGAIKTVAISVTPDPSVLVATLSLVGVKTGTKSIRLNWVDGNLSEDGYSVEKRSKSIGSPNWSLWKQEATTPADATQYVKTVNRGKVYEYRIRPFKLAGDFGPYSNIVKIKVP